MDQAVSFSAASITIVGILLGAMAAAITALWIESRRKDKSRDSAIADLIKRIRQLEDARVEDMKVHAEEIKSIAFKFQSSQQAMTGVMKELLQVLKQRKCLHDSAPDPRPSNIPQIETDVLTPK